jgi:hypothetical protein
MKSSIRRGHHAKVRITTPGRPLALTATVHRWNHDNQTAILQADPLPAPGLYLATHYDFAELPAGSAVLVEIHPIHERFTAVLVRGYGPRLSVRFVSA